MKITQLRIDRFGVWSGLEIDQLNAPMVVFYGENEAGKTTLMQFVRTVLYGFSPARRERYVPPRSSKPGGSLTVDVAHQTLVVHRYLDVRSGEETLEVVDRDGQHHPLRGLARLLDGIDESVYNGVFAFGLREIQELATLSDSAAADLLYELTLGIDRVSLHDVVGQLQTSRERLLSDGEHPGKLLELLEQRDRLRGQIENLRGSTPEYLATAKKHEDLNQSAQALEAEEAELDDRLRMLTVAAQIEPRWHHRQEVERRRAALEPVPHLADDALTRLAELKTRRETRRRRLERVTQRRRDLMAEVDRLKINEALCRHAPRLEALAEQQQWIAALEAQEKQLAAELGSAHPKHPTGAQGHAKPHPADTHGHAKHHPAAHAPAESQPSHPVPSKPLTAQSSAQLLAHAKTVSQLHRRYRKSAKTLAVTKESAEHAQRRLKADLGPHEDTSLTDALEKAGELVSQLRRRVQIEERLSSLANNQHDLEAHVNDPANQQALGFGHVVGLGVIFALGSAMIGAAFLLPAGTIGSSHWPVAVIGIGLCVASGLAKVFLERFAGTQLADGHTQLAQVEQQIEKVQAERDELDKKLPRGGGPLVARLQAAEKEHARLEELMPLDAEHQSHGQSLNAGRQKHKAAKQEFHKARDRWQQLLRQAGLPAELTPKQLRAALEHGERLDTEKRHLDDRQRQLADCRRQHEILSGRIIDLAADSRLELDETEPLPILKEMLRRLEDERIRAASRDQLRAHLTKIRRVRRKLLRQAATAGKRVSDLIHAAGSKDEEDLRRRAAIVDEARELDRQRDHLAEEIAAGLAGCDAAAAVAAHLDAGDDPRRLAEETTGAKHALRGKLGHVWEERGAIAQRLKAMTQDRSLADKRLELATVASQLREATQRWQVLSACSLALESVRAIYERDRQPEVLREASTYLAELTAGKYRRIWTTLGGRMLSVDDVDGTPVAVDVLSCGTREQIFLSLRLALVSAYARRGIRLPVVMDDVLVNFDVTRAKAAVDVLAEFARAGHQILVFTCHEHLARLFHDARVEVRALAGGSLPWQQPASVAWDEPAPEPIRAASSVPPPHFLPEPVQAPTIEIIEEEVEAASPPPPPPVPTPPPVPAPRRNGHAARPRRAKPAVATRPAPEPRRRRTSSVESVPWSAEEFEGELVDRVRRSVFVDHQDGQPAPVILRHISDAEEAGETAISDQTDAEDIHALIADITDDTLDRATRQPSPSRVSGR